MVYKTMEELLFTIERPINRRLLEVYREHLGRFQAAQGSQHNHQPWVGGYLDHVTDTMNIARALWANMNSLRQLPFKISDALVVLFLHDIEKAWPEEINQLCLFGMPRTKAKDRVRYDLLHSLRVWDLLTNDQRNAIDNVEGEKENYTPTHRIMGPLGAFAHMCDVASARIWFDRPLLEDSWGWRESIATEERSNVSQETTLQSKV